MEILGEIREPLALPLLVKISEVDADPDVRQAAKYSLSKLTLEAPDTPWYKHLQANQIQVAIVMVGMIVILIWYMVKGLITGMGARYLLLLLLPTILCAEFTWVSIAQCWRGRIDVKTIDGVITQGDLVALRSMNYQEYTDFPGNSFLTRRLVALGDENVIRLVKAVIRLEPDDLDDLKDALNLRSQWILSRIVAAKLGTPEFDQFLYSDDRDVRLTVANTLAKLRIQNSSITSALEILEADADKEVSIAAAEALQQVRKYREWDPKIFTASS